MQMLFVWIDKQWTWSMRYEAHEANIQSYLFRIQQKQLAE